jgi:hypothetical protein
MSNSSLTPEERRERLEEARQALQWGDSAAQKRALKRLPTTGVKAATLREQLEERLQLRQIQLPMMVAERATPPDEVARVLLVAEPGVAPRKPACHVSGGFHFRFCLAEVDSSALFLIRAVGAEATIVLNAHHPALPDILVGQCETSAAEPQIHPAFRRLLLAWARLELDGPVGVYRERLQQLREDLGRLMRPGDDP